MLVVVCVVPTILTMTFLVCRAYTGEAATEAYQFDFIELSDRHVCPPIHEPYYCLHLSRALAFLRYSITAQYIFNAVCDRVTAITRDVVSLSVS